MKLDCEPAFFHSKVSRKSDNKPIEHNLNALDVDGMSFEHKTMKEIQNVVFYDLNGHETKSFDHADCVGNSENFPGDGERNPLVPCTYSNRETESVPKVIDKFYVDKSVGDGELPELTVCYKESMEHVVKDIGVDEGVPCKDKFLFETVADESKVDKACSYPVKEQINELAIGVDDTGVCSPDGRKNLDNNDLDKEFDDQSNSKYSVRSGYEEVYAEDKNAEYEFEETTSAVIASSEQLGKSQNCSTEKADNEDTKETSSVNLNISGSNSDAFEGNKYREQCTQIPNVEVNLVSSASVSDGEGPRNSAEEAVLTNDLGSNQAAENGSSTSNRDFSTPAPSSGDERPINDLRELLENENASRIEGGPSDRWLVSNRITNNNGETSFSVNGAMSGRISYSGPIPYSGSVSMRSDSSTTSVRSFAFPVIQSEWHSSPARMAKADRKHLRKHKRWKDAFLCCRF